MKSASRVGRMEPVIRHRDRLKWKIELEIVAILRLSD